MKNKMYLTKVNEGGVIFLKIRNAKNVSVIILDKFKRKNIKPCTYHLDNVIIVDEMYAGLDACCFYEY